VLAADAAAGLDAELQDRRPQGLHPVVHPRLTGPVKNQGVQVAVAGVEHIGHRQPVLLAEPLNRRQHLGQGRAGHHAVLQVVAGELAAQG
jgi:hypothetical protein